MARVISWVIDNKYVYIEKQGSSYVRDSKLSNEETKALGSRVTSWEESTYRTNFEAMRTEVVGRWGSSVDLKNDYRYYFDATGNEGVYMLTGLDGANVADYGKPFYNLVIENNNTSLGLGGDYTLDIAVTLKTTIFLEKNGSKYAPDTVNVTSGGRPVDGVYTENGDEAPKIKVCIPIPAGTRFDSNEHVIEYTIEALKDGYSGKVVFTVVGVKDGEEGVSYDLIVSPRVIKVTEDGNVSAHTVRCKALRNGVDASSDPHIAIKYDFGQATIDDDDLVNVYPETGLTYETISENGDQVNFYLLYNGRIVDTDSCYVSRDGQSGGFVKLELDNEMDGVSVGNDTDLDLDDGEYVTLSTGFVMYSGGTEMRLTGQVKVENMDFTHSSYRIGGGGGAYSEWFSDDSEHDANVIDSERNGKIYFRLENGFDFGEDHKDAIKITVWGTNPMNGVTTSATAIYTVMAIRGGKDGEVFKLIPNLDVIMCDPNAEKPFDTEAVPYLYAEAYLGTERIQNPEIRYSIDVTYGDSYNDAIPMPNNETISIANLIANDNSYVTFYLWTADTNNTRILVDRESVPIIWNGADGSSVWVELGNEVDAISVGNDTDLDLDHDVTVGTTVRIVSGGTPVKISAIGIIPPAGTEANWNQYAEWTYTLTESGTLGNITVTLKDGFEFGDDYREVLTVTATAATASAGEAAWTGFTNYVLKGIPGGKDGYVYRLAPEVDYIHFHPNEGNDGTFDFGESNIRCTAFYGEYELGSEGFNDAKIYYSWNKICTTTADTSGGGYITGFTEYTSAGVEVDGVINKDNYTNFRYLVFYLVKDGDIIDRETVPLIADGIDGHDNITVELTNEIESIGVGADSDLDLEPGTTAKASTGVRMFSGATPMTILSVTGALSVNTDTGSNTYRFNWNSAEQEFEVELYNGFEFGDDLKEKVVITVTGKNDANEEATAYATFVLAAIKGGKDGAVYKVWPTPDYVYYDLQTGNWGGDTNGVRAYAFLNGKKMLEQGLREGADYQIKTTQGIVMDVDNAEEQWNNNGVLSNYDEGSPYSFSTPAGAAGREQSIVFYLGVKLNGSDKWTVVDRESVGLFINGKEGKDGASSVIFDLSNENWVVTTGDDNILDISGSITGGTIVTCSSGNTYARIHITTGTTGSLGSNCRVTITDNDSVHPKITVTLYDQFNFGSTQRKEIYVSGVTLLDGFSGMCTFGLVGVHNGKEGTEGISYSLKTNAGSVLYDSNLDVYSPTSLTVRLFENITNVTSSHTFKYQLYDSEGDPVSTVQTIGGGTNEKTISGLDTILRNNSLTIGKIGITASTVSGGEERDSADIPIVSSGKDGSGIVMDLTNDRDTIAVGSDLILDADVDLEDATVASVFEGSTQLQITGSAITVDSLSSFNNSRLHITPRIENGNSIVLNIQVDAGFKFAELEGQQVAIMIHATATTKDNTSVEKSVKYTIHGFEAGEDGHVYRIVTNCTSIKYDAARQMYMPASVSARTEVNGVPQDFFMIYTYDEDDPEQVQPYSDQYHEESLINIAEEASTNGLNNSITFYAYDRQGGTLLDKETIFIVRDGRDGEGGPHAEAEPSQFFIQCANGTTSAAFHDSSLITLWSGSTAAAIQGITASTANSSLIGRGTSSSAPIKYTITDASGYPNRKYFNITADTGMNLSEPIQIKLSVRFSQNTSVTVYTSVMLNPSTGGKGDKGPITRMRDWAPNEQYFDGTGNDKYWDFVYYDGYYYGCIGDHTSSASLPPDQDYNGAAGVSNPHWERYEGATFTASKIGFFGQGVDGWLIDWQRIMHTTSSITLNGTTAAIEIKNNDYSVDKYVNGSSTLYIKEKFKDNQSYFEANKDNYITVYNDQACTEGIENMYALSGTASSPTLVFNDGGKNVKFWIKSVNTTLYPEIESPISTDISIEISYRLYKTSFTNTERSNGTTYSKSAYLYECTNTSVISAGELTGTKTVITNLIDSVTETGNSPLTDSAVWRDKFGFYPSPEASSGLRMRSAEVSQEGGIIVDGDWEGEQPSICPEGGGGGGGGTYDPVISTTTGNTIFVRVINISVTGHHEKVWPYFASDWSKFSIPKCIEMGGSSTARGFTPSSAESTGKSWPAGTVYTYAGSVDIQSGDDIPLTAVINGNVNEDSKYGNIIIAAGINGINVSAQKWVSSSNEVLYTIGDVSSLANGSTTSAFAGSETPSEVSVTKKSNTVLTFDGTNYTKSGSTQSMNAANFADTRIYNDGTLVTSKLVATDGAFNGIINAESGNFYGGLNAANCKLTSASIQNSFFEGTVNVTGGNMLSVLYPNREPLLSASNSVVSEGARQYSAAVFQAGHNGSWLGLGTRTISDASETLFSGISVSSGQLITIPRFVLTVEGKKIKSCTVDIYMNGFRTEQQHDQVVHNITSPGTYSTNAHTFTASKAGTINIYVTYSFSIGAGSGKISLDGKFDGQIEVGQGKSGAYFAFGSNGLYLTDGMGSILLKNNNSLFLKYGTNGIEISKNDIIVYAGTTQNGAQITKKYSLRGLAIASGTT